MIVLTVILILPRIGEGSLGGKGRGLAFIDNMVKRHVEFDEFENATVVIPKTVVLCTDVFDEFMTLIICIRLRCQMRMMLRF